MANERQSEGSALVAVPINGGTHGGALQIGGGRSLHEVKRMLNEFRAFVKDVLVRDVDFGVIPGTKKACLFKPGAERITQLYNLAPHYVVDVSQEDFASKVPFFNYRIKCELVQRSSGEIVGEGIGSCNSKESKYRYRVEYWNEKKTSPPPDQGWKQNKYGWKRQTENQDTADVANTVLKMAKKRAFIDAALTVAAASEFFTQDTDTLPVDLRAIAEDEIEAKTSNAPAAEPGTAPTEATLRAAVKGCTSLYEFQAVVAKVAKQPENVKTALKPDLEAKRTELRAADAAKHAAEVKPPENPDKDPEWMDPGPPDDDHGNDDESGRNG